MYSYPNIIGQEAESGRRYLCVTHMGRVAWMPWESFASSSPSQLIRTFAARGIVVVSENAARVLIREGSHDDKFVVRALIEHPGWNGDDFALPTGELMRSSHGKKRDVVFERRARGVMPNGTREQWMTEVVDPLDGQHLLAFALLIPFMIPICEFTSVERPFGFEIVAPPGSGKSTLQALLASVMSTLGAYVDPAESFAEAVGNDLLMVAGDISLQYIGQSKSRRLEAFKTHVLGLGQERGQQSHAPVYATFATEPLADALGVDLSLSSAAVGKLITLRPFGGTGPGLLDHLPDTYPTGAEFAHAVIAGAKATRGVAMREFLRWLVHERKEDEAALRKRIADKMAQFRLKADVDLNNGNAVRVVDIFACVYAAGSVMKEAGLLPQNWRLGAAVLKTFQSVSSLSAQQPHFVDVLRKLVSLPEVIDLREEADWRSTAEIDAGNLFIKVTSGSPEFVIRAKAIKSYIPDWARWQANPEMTATLIPEKDRTDTKRRLRKEDHARVVAFHLPADEE